MADDLSIQILPSDQGRKLDVTASAPSVGYVLENWSVPPDTPIGTIQNMVKVFLAKHIEQSSST